MITFSICTHNRANDAIECASAILPRLDYTEHLMVVDSGSDQNNASILSEWFTSNLPGSLHVVPAPGLSRARNTALSLCTSEWIVFLDDDALPFPDYLENIRRFIKSANADIVGFGGKVVPLWPANVSHSHISPRWKFFLSTLESDRATNLADGGYVCGANIAFRSKPLRAIGGFDEDLGRTATNLMGGEEIDVIRKLTVAGGVFLYEPSIAVYHRIPPQRLTLDWISDRAAWEGKTIAALANRQRPGRFSLFLFQIKLTISFLVMAALYRLTSNPDFLIRSKIAESCLADLLKTQFKLG